jgi:hypothetical protein
VTRFRKKPVEIEAVQWTGKNFCDSAEFLGTDFRGSEGGGPDGMYILIDTLENPDNPFRAPVGWWLIRGVKGEHYACAPDIFEATYEAVDE